MSQFDYTKKLDIYAPMVLQSFLHTDEQGGALKNSDLSDTQKLGKGYIAVSYTHLTLPTNREV